MFSAAAAAIFRLLVGLRLTDGIGREELFHRKSDVPEEPAGVLGGAAAALLLRHAVVIDRDQELRIPLQPDDGELPQGHIDPAAIPAGAETALKAVVDESRDLRQLRLTAAVFPAAVTFAAVGDAGVQHDGVHRLYGLHQVGMQSSSSLQIARYF